MNEERFEERLLVRRRNPWIVALAAVPFLFAVIAIVQSVITGGSAALGAFYAVPLGIIIGRTLLGRNVLARESTEMVRAKHDAIVLGAETIPRERVESAVVVPGPPRPRVELRLRGTNLGPREVEVRTVSHGRALLHALGFDATQRVFETTTASWLRSTWPRSVASMAIAFTGALLSSGLCRMLGVPNVFGIFAFALPIAVLFALPTRIRVGADGVHLRWLWWSRFLPIRDVVTSDVWYEQFRNGQRVGVNVTMTSGEVVRLPVGTATDAGRAQALRERIQEVLGASEHEGASALEAEGLLARLARTGATAEWLRALRSLGSGAVATHRVAAVDPETLYRVVEDAAARPVDRAAAAVALATQGDESRARIRVLAETVAEPKLRVALERAADEAPELEESLDELDESSQA